MKFHPRSDFSKYNPSKGILIGGRLITMLYPQLSFNNPTATPPVIPPVSQAELQAAVTLLSVTNVDAFKGGNHATQIRDAALVALIILFYKLAKFVDLIADGNQAMVTSTGFESTNDEVDHTPVMVPVLKSLVAHVGGDSVATFEPDPSARGREWGYKPTTPPEPAIPDGSTTIWVGFCTGSKLILHGLTPGVVYKVVFRGIGPGINNFTAETEPIDHRAL